MLTLTYGYKKPETGDKGSIFFPALEYNIQQLNDHTHNGINSSKLNTSSSVVMTSTILAANWIDSGAGYWYQIITMPAGILYDEVIISFKNSASPYDLYYLKCVKVSANSFSVSINDPSISLLAVYSS